MTKSQNKDVLAELDRLLKKENEAYAALERNPSTQKYRKAQAKILEEVKAVGKSGHVDAILELEKIILEHERYCFGRTKRERTKLTLPLKRLAIVEKLFNLVRDPETYATIAKSYSSKMRTRDAPKDAAHLSFKDLDIMLSKKLLRPRMTKTEVATIEARRKNLRIVEKSYASLQRQTLG